MSLLFSLLISGLTGFIAGYVGSLMSSKKLTLAGGALGHLTIPGISLAIIYGFNPSIGALIFLIIGIIIIWLLELKTKLSLEILTAVVFASSVAIAFLFIGDERIVPALIGDVSQITIKQLLITTITTIIIFILTNLIYNKIILINISKGLSKSIGINIKKSNFIFLLIIALTVTLSVRIVGGLMTAAIIAIPSATSRLFTHNIKSYSYSSAIIGLTSCIIGVLLSTIINLPAGPLIIIINSIIFLITTIIY